jgi:hypothetical protein
MPYLIVNTVGFAQAVSEIYLALFRITFIYLLYKHGAVLKLAAKIRNKKAASKSFNVVYI